ncbi:hypothetical protein ACYPJF_06150 [Stenotrophomonas geniculata]
MGNIVADGGFGGFGGFEHSYRFPARDKQLIITMLSACLVSRRCLNGSIAPLLFCPGQRFIYTCRIAA